MSKHQIRDKLLGSGITRDTEESEYPRKSDRLVDWEILAFDMHTHSRFSVGTTSAAEVVESAAQAGLLGVARTDDDTTAERDPAEADAAEHETHRDRGMEV